MSLLEHQSPSIHDHKSDASFTTDNSGSNNPDLDAGADVTDTENAAASLNQEFLDALEDVHTRFLLNLQPESDLETAEKIFFQLEQAWWFYEDWICDPAANANTNDDFNSNLPRFNHLKPFAMKMFDYSPLLPDVKEFPALWNDFVQYKRKISNFGCILLNEDCSKLILCQVWNGKSHTFPSGKINKGESGVDAATRETYEETGFDPHCKLGKTRDLLAAATTNGGSVPWNFPLQEQDALSYQEADGGKRRTCYVCCGVPEDFPFEPVCRKEVSKIDWYPLDNLPKPHYAVGPFMNQLKRWIKKYKKRTHSSGGGKKKKRSSAKKDQRNNSKPRNSKERDNSTHKNSQYETPRRGGYNTPGSSRSGSRAKSQPGSRPNSRPSSRPGSRPRNKAERDALVESGLLDQTASGGAAGWSEEEMFQVNEKLLGRKIDYDGNPHQFAEKGFFGGQDPHAFHVVGGSFLNSDNTLPPAPSTSKLQPLFRQHSDGDELRPFFSDDGATPWGDVVTAVAPQARMIPSVASPTVEQNQQQSAKKNKRGQRQQSSQNGLNENKADEDLVFTDAEITKKSQASKDKKLAALALERLKGPSRVQSQPSSKEKEHKLSQDPVKKLQQLRSLQQQQYEADMKYIQDWVANLPKPRPTPHFGEFRLDAEAILSKVMHEKA